MKQLLLATAAIVGMSSAALAAEPVALTDSQLDNVTAGQTVSNILVPTLASQGGLTGVPGLPPAPPAAAAVGPSSSGTNLVIGTVTIPN